MGLSLLLFLSLILFNTGFICCMKRSISPLTEKFNPHLNSFQKFITIEHHRKVFSKLFYRDYTGCQDVESKLSVFFNDPKVADIMSNASIIFLSSSFASANVHVSSFFSQLDLLLKMDSEGKFINQKLEEFLGDLRSFCIAKKNPYFSYAAGRVINFINSSLNTAFIQCFQHDSIYELLSYNYLSNDYDSCVDHFVKQMSEYIQFLQREIFSQPGSTPISLLQRQLKNPENTEFVYVDKLSFDSIKVTYGIDYTDPEHSDSLFSTYQLPPEEERFYNTSKDMKIAQTLLENGKRSQKKTQNH